MVERFGDDSLAKMLIAYRDNLNTDEAVQRCFEISLKEFEQGYREHVLKLVQDVQGDGTGRSMSQLQEAVEDNPDDSDALAELSHALLERKSNADARRHALKALEVEPQQQLAAYVVARLYLSIGDTTEAVKYLRDSFQEDAPQSNHLALLAGILLRAKKTNEAERLYELGARSFLHDEAWLKRLASVYLQSGEDEKLADVLEQLTQLTTDSLAFRTKLAQLAMKRKDFPQAERWAMEALHIDIKDAQLHALRAEAFAAQEMPRAAAKEYRYALELSAEKLDWRMALARSYADSDQREAARVELEKVLRANRKFPGAQELLDELDGE